MIRIGIGREEALKSSEGNVHIEEKEYVEGMVDDVRRTFMVVLGPTTILAPADEGIGVKLLLRHYLRSVLEDQG